MRGLYGEHSEIMGNLFQISNQTTLGAQLGAVTMQGNAANVYGIGDSRQSN